MYLVTLFIRRTVFVFWDLLPINVASRLGIATPEPNYSDHDQYEATEVDQYQPCWGRGEVEELVEPHLHLRTSSAIF